jgi:hypothetical protein
VTLHNNGYETTAKLRFFLLFRFRFRHLLLFCSLLKCLSWDKLRDIVIILCSCTSFSTWYLLLEMLSKPLKVVQVIRA